MVDPFGKNFYSNYFDAASSIIVPVPSPLDFYPSMSYTVAQKHNIPSTLVVQ